MKNHLKTAAALVAAALAGALLTSWVRHSPDQALAQEGDRLAPGAVIGPPGGVSFPVYRYHLAPLGGAPHGEQRFAIIDTRTGRCWTGSTSGNTLSAYGVPPGADKP